MSDKIKILFLDDCLTDIELLQFQLKKDGIIYTSEITQDRDSYEKALIAFKPDIILSDYNLPAFDGHVAFQIKQTLSPETPFIIISGTIGEHVAVDLIKQGVTDCNLKNNLFAVAPKIIRALSEAREHKEKIAAEKALALSEERYRYLFYNNPMPMWIYSDETNKFLEINNMAIDKYEYSREEFLSMSIDDIIPVEDKELHYSIVKEALQYGGAHHGIWRHLKKNGELIFVEITAHLIDYKGRKATLLLSNDITERKKAEEELKHSNALLIKNEEKLKEAQTLGHIGSWELDLAHDKTSWSDEIYSILGIVKSESEPSSELLLSFVLPEDMAEVKKNIQESYDSLQDSSFNFRFMRKDGDIRYGYIERKFEFDKNNIAIRYFGIIQDISERKKTEQIIRKSEEKYRTLIEQAADAIFINDLQGNILEANDSGSNLLGYTKEELVKMNVKDLYSKEELLSRPIMFKELFAGERTHAERKILHSNGSEIPVDITGKMLSDGRIMAILRNITERKKAEQEILARNKKLRNLSNQLEKIREQERTHIAREIHDELGQQLTAIKMDVDWVSRKQNNQDIIVVKKLQNMLSQCDDVIGTIRRIASDLRPGILDDLGLIAALEWKCSDFEERTGTPCKFMSKAEERKFENHFSINVFRILQETLTNITRHAAANSVTVSVSENETELLLEITDNGKGVNNENIKSGKTLGITGMRERAALLGGELTITGTPNKGTITTLTLPFKDEYTTS